LVGERFILKIHQNTANSSYFVDNLHQRNQLLLKVSVNKVRITGCFDEFLTCSRPVNKLTTAAMLNGFSNKIFAGLTVKMSQQNN